MYTIDINLSSYYLHKNVIYGIKDSDDYNSRLIVSVDLKTLKSVTYQYNKRIGRLILYRDELIGIVAQSEYYSFKTFTLIPNLFPYCNLNVTANLWSDIFDLFLIDSKGIYRFSDKKLIKLRTEILSHSTTTDGNGNLYMLGLNKNMLNLLIWPNACSRTVKSLFTLSLLTLINKAPNQLNELIPDLKERYGL